MPLTRLDDRFALIVIDLQKGLTRLETVHPIGEIIERTAQLARSFRERGQPVVLVNVTGGAPGRTDVIRPKFSTPADWTDLVPELEEQAADHLVSKQRPGAFIGTSLDAHLRQLEVTQVFVAGVSTSVGVESTVRSAYDHGYNVVTVLDAMTDRDADSHRHSVEEIFPRLSETTTTEEALALLQ